MIAYRKKCVNGHLRRKGTHDVFFLREIAYTGMYAAKKVRECGKNTISPA